MIRHYTLQELTALSIHELNQLETNLLNLLDQTDPNSDDAETIHHALKAIAKAKAFKQQRCPSP